MKNLVSIFTILIASVTASLAIGDSLKLDLVYGSGTRFVAVFGADTDALDKYDPMDRNQPPFVPPNGAYTMGTTVESDESVSEYLRKDMRMGFADSIFTITYEFQILGSLSNQTYRFEWNVPKSAESAFIGDRFLGNGEYLHSADMKTESSLEMSAPINFWEVIVTWNFKNTSVDDFADNIPNKLNYTLENSVLSFSDTFDRLYLINSSGSLAISKDNVNLIDINMLATGAYFIVAEKDSEIYSEKLIITQ
ncbi:MAG: hypothetical protein Kapaf2KO_03480 [Candidatus Kapaibacteriales bacterium]